MNKSYSAKTVFVTCQPAGWDGPSLVLNDGARTTGDFCVVAMSADESTITPAQEGGGVVNLMPGTDGTITVTLLGAARQNNALSDARRYQKREGIPRAWQIQVKDGQGSTLHSCPFAVIQGSPPDSFAEEKGDRVWVFLCPSLDMDHREADNLGGAMST